MNKKTKIIIGILVCLIIAIVVYLSCTYCCDFNKSSDTKQVVAMNAVENKILENNIVTNNIINENTIKENIIIENTVQNNVVEEEKKENTVENEDSELQADTDEEKAIAIAKNDWGATEGYYFKAQPNSDGTYDVSVSDENTAVVAWYTVNPKTGSFTK